MSGKIPSTFKNLVLLEKLSLFDNSLFGVVPSILGDLVNLEELILSDNLFYGTIPTELSNLTKLKVLMLNNNDLKGDFAALAKSIPTMLQFEYINLNETSNSVLVDTD